jgi:hypothetical protein
MTIDERLQFLLQSTESLHASLEREVEERRAYEKGLHAALAALEAKEKLHRRAVLEAMEAYLKALDKGAENGNQS